MSPAPPIAPPIASYRPTLSSAPPAASLQMPGPVAVLPFELPTVLVQRWRTQEAADCCGSQFSHVRANFKQGSSPVRFHPSPRCFLEVLILNGLQTPVSEVLILGDLWPRLLILLDFKSFIISDLIKNEEFAEVLILEGLGHE